MGHGNDGQRGIAVNNAGFAWWWLLDSTLAGSAQVTQIFASDWLNGTRVASMRLATGTARLARTTSLRFTTQRLWRVFLTP